MLVYNKVIGMFTINRPRQVTCLKYGSATVFCRQHCYNNTVEENWNWSIDHEGDEQFWQELTGQKLWNLLKNMRSRYQRIRLASRGEAICLQQDIDKIIDLAVWNPNTLFWIPTRAWRIPKLRTAIENQLLAYWPNLRIQASVDPSNTQGEIDTLISHGWSTMFFGSDSNQARKGRQLCPKTWFHEKTSCRTCDICFSARQTHVHLREHGNIYARLRTCKKYKGLSKAKKEAIRSAYQ